MQLAQVLLHAGRLELEGTDGLPLLIELEGLRVVDGYGVEVEVDAASVLYVLAGFLLLRKGLQSEEVHLDEACRLDDVSVVLRHGSLHVGEVGVVGCRYGHVVGDRVAADDEAAGVYAGAAHGAFEHASVFDGVAFALDGRVLGFLQERDVLDGVGEVHLIAVGQSVGYGLAPSVHDVEGHLLHTGYVLYGVLRGHGCVGDDVGAVLFAVLVHHPAKHLAAPVVVEVGVDIRQRDAVRIEEALEQQVVLQRVDLRDAKAVGHHRARSRSTSRTHPHVELRARCVDEVLHDEEVAREAHGLHDVQLEANAVLHIAGYAVGATHKLIGRKVVRRAAAVDPLRALVGQLREVVGLELHAVELIVAAQLLDLLQSLLFGQRILAVLVARELPEEVGLGVLLAPLLFGAERLGYGEEGHDGVRLEAVGLHLVEHFHRIGQRFGHVGEDFGHLGARLEPLLLRVAHA